MGCGSSRSGLAAEPAIQNPPGSEKTIKNRESETCLNREEIEKLLKFKTAICISSNLDVNLVNSVEREYK
jgi:hypothetical protein